MARAAALEAQIVTPFTSMVMVVTSDAASVAGLGAARNCSASAASTIFNLYDILLQYVGVVLI